MIQLLISHSGSMEERSVASLESFVDDSNKTLDDFVGVILIPASKALKLWPIPITW